MYFLLSWFIIYLKSLFAEPPVLSRKKPGALMLQSKKKKNHTLLSTMWRTHNTMFFSVCFSFKVEMTWGNTFCPWWGSSALAMTKWFLQMAELTAAVFYPIVQCFIYWLTVKWGARDEDDDTACQQGRHLNRRHSQWRNTFGVSFPLVSQRCLELSPLFVSAAERLKTVKLRTFDRWCTTHTLCVFSLPALALSRCVCPASVSSCDCPWLVSPTGWGPARCPPALPMNYDVLDHY